MAVLQTSQFNNGHLDRVIHPFWISPISKYASYAVLGWERINFLHSTWYGAMLWICSGDRVGDLGIF